MFQQCKKMNVTTLWHREIAYILAVSPLSIPKPFDSSAEAATPESGATTVVIHCAMTDGTMALVRISTYFTLPCWKISIIEWNGTRNGLNRPFIVERRVDEDQSFECVLHHGCVVRGWRRVRKHSTGGMGGGEGFARYDILKFPCFRSNVEACAIS